MPITMYRSTLAVHKIGGYNDAACQGKCDKCGWDAFKDGALMTTADAVVRIFHVCGNCGYDTVLLTANITDFPCLPIKLPDITGPESLRSQAKT